ncbi:F-box/LRR-repeat protein 4 [Benincasa hispida]|uniref:F-box/LRR-repeat protein 4 n=1 Tax=Benincasa hispida TaxID=102211 RepID=UPI001902AF53|nr:F-box/LRR-repeat protein 4 [Benincasa hispida]
MDSLLCDELIQEIFQKLPSPSSSAVSLVSKRWLRLYRTSKTALSLRLYNLSVSSLSSLLSHYPFLSSLSILSADSSATPVATPSAEILSEIRRFCTNLKALRFLAGPVSLSSLVSLSSACTHLASLSINIYRPLNFRWVVNFPGLKWLSVSVISGEGFEIEVNSGDWEWESAEVEVELGIQSLCLSGLRAGDWGVGWLWRSCKNLRQLQLRGCETVGDGGSFSSFVECLPGLCEVELRTCRSIADGVLMKLAENCRNLTSLLVYDGGSREGLLQFLGRQQRNLENLDLRLPLDLNNEHLVAIAMNLQDLSSLRLQSCCLITGDGLKAIGTALGSRLEELALINCDVVERESGLLATMGQNLKQLKSLDLSHNETLMDKDFISMIISCNSIKELKLRGCKWLTGAAIFALWKNCKDLETIDIVQCPKIHSISVELYAMNLPKLRQLKVEDDKIYDIVRNSASRQFVEIVA